MNAIFQSHGDIDMKVLLNWAQRAADVMKPLVEELEFKTYKEVGHKVTDMQVRELLIVFALRIADGLFSDGGLWSFLRRRNIGRGRLSD